jgi:SNF2 family DNA or RNA helicase
VTVHAYAELGENRILVRTRASGHEFQEALATCKRVRGGRFSREPTPHWHYPLSVDTCRALRDAFGPALKVGVALAAWYTEHHRIAEAQARLSASADADLPTLAASHPEFVTWLRPSQRVGALWVARGYRDAGLVGDVPGVGKTTEVLAGLVESGRTGPVLVICPKASVNAVWGKELRAHLPDVPAYLCSGTREQRSKELARFANDMQQDREALCVVVVVAEMLRVVLGDPCWTVREVIGDDGLRREKVPANKISGMCPQRLKSLTMECTLHIQLPVEKEKEKVPVDFSYPALFDRYLLGGGWAHVIIDESHKLLGSLTVVKGNLMGLGLKLLPERAEHRRYALSGTPFGKAGRVEGLFGTLHWLWPDEYTSYWKWVGEKFEVTKEVVNRRGLQVHRIGALRGLRANATPDEESAAWERFVRELGPRVLRRTKEEAFKDLPPKQYAETVCTMSGQQLKQYRSLVLDAEVPTIGGPIMANGSLALLTRSRQLANGALVRDAGGVHFVPEESCKIEALIVALEERGVFSGTPGGKLIVASAFNEFLDAVALRLEKEGLAAPLRYDGRRSAQQRDAVIEQWQVGTRAVGGQRILLLNAQAGGLSITLDAADEMHIMDELPDPGANTQLEDRIHRMSRVHYVLITYYRTQGSVDYERAHNVEFRRRMQHELLDGRRGVADTRAALTEAFHSLEEE